MRGHNCAYTSCGLVEENHTRVTFDVWNSRKLSVTVCGVFHTINVFLTSTIHHQILQTQHPRTQYIFFLLFTKIRVTFQRVYLHECCGYLYDVYTSYTILRHQCRLKVTADLYKTPKS